jgi:hypothetical protein
MHQEGLTLFREMHTYILLVLLQSALFIISILIYTVTSCLKIHLIFAGRPDDLCFEEPVICKATYLIAFQN